MSQSKHQKSNGKLPQVNKKFFLTADVNVLGTKMAAVHCLAKNVAKAVSVFSAQKGEVKPKIGNSLYALLREIGGAKAVYITSVTEKNGDAGRLLDYFKKNKPPKMVATMTDHGTIAIGFNIGQDDLRETLVIAEEAGWFNSYPAREAANKQAA